MQIIKNIIFLILTNSLYSVGFVKASWYGVKLGRGAKVHPKAKIKSASYIGNAQIAKSVTMGQGSYINSGLISNSQIGNFVSIAYNVIIGPTEHNTHLPSMSPHSPIIQSINISSDLPVKNVVIEDEVWIGANSVILQGVTVGYGSVVAAGAVVTKDIPKMEIWGGVPAKKIKDRIIKY